MPQEHPLKILVTAGSTNVPIDQVRCLSNIFKGRTGTEIAAKLAEQSHKVTLLTSSPKMEQLKYCADKLEIISYRTFWELFKLMEREICNRPSKYDVIIHSAAVSDYEVTATCFIDETGQLQTLDSSTKISSDHQELFLKLRPTPKIVDQIRQPWGFKGLLIKFKLQAGIIDEELLAIAAKSRIVSGADLIVANCLEWSAERAYLVSEKLSYSVERQFLPAAISHFIRQTTDL
jgi:phosphopantothenate---cysteine ligase (CTP)